jgi:hypothetical protein
MAAYPLIRIIELVAMLAISTSIALVALFVWCLPMSAAADDVLVEAIRHQPARSRDARDLRPPRYRRQGNATRSAPHRLRFWTGCDEPNSDHKEGGIGSFYDRHRYSAENQKIMEAVAADITGLAEAGPTSANLSEALRRVRLSV